jgi:hypothetical protein
MSYNKAKQRIVALRPPHRCLRRYALYVMNKFLLS